MGYGRRRIGAAVLAVIGCLVGFADRAAAATTPVGVEVLYSCDTTRFTCASSYARWSGSSATLSQRVRVTAIGRTTYLALYWTGGYLGIQTDGNSVSGELGTTAVFSMSGEGAEFRPIKGVPAIRCEGGFDGDPGVSCRVPLGAAIGSDSGFTYRVESYGDGWYAGKVTRPDGSVLHIGDLKPAPSSPTGFTSVGNFMEYFGERVPTVADIPYVRARFSAPIGGSTFTAARLTGVCTTASRTDGGLAVLTNGGGTPCSSTSSP